MNENLFLIISCILFVIFIKNFIIVFIILALLVYLSKFLELSQPDYNAYIDKLKIIII